MCKYVKMNVSGHYSCKINDAKHRELHMSVCKYMSICASAHMCVYIYNMYLTTSINNVLILYVCRELHQSLPSQNILDPSFGNTASLGLSPRRIERTFEVFTFCCVMEAKFTS